MSFQGFQGVVNTGSNVGGTNASRAALLKRTRDRIAAAKAKRDAITVKNLANNRTGTGSILDTNKTFGGTSKQPKSKFNIIGGKAVTDVGRNITSSTSSIKRRDGTRVNVNSTDLTRAEKEALGIFAGQQQATNNKSLDIFTKRRFAALSGNSIKESQKIATNPLNTKFSTDDRITVNQVLQQNIIDRNDNKLQFAEQLINEQTDTNNSLGSQLNSIDNLQKQLENAPNFDRRLQVQLDENGNLISKRNVALQILNLKDPSNTPVNIISKDGVIPNTDEIRQALEDGINEKLDGAGLTNTTEVITNPDGTLQVQFTEESAVLIRKLVADSVFEVLGRFFDLKDQGANDFFDNPDGFRFKVNGQDIGGGSGNASDLLNQDKGFDFISVLNNPIFLIIIAVIIGIVTFMVLRK